MNYQNEKYDIDEAASTVEDGLVDSILFVSSEYETVLDAQLEKNSEDGRVAYRIGELGDDIQNGQRVVVQEDEFEYLEVEESTQEELSPAAEYLEERFQPVEEGSNPDAEHLLMEEGPSLDI